MTERFATRTSTRQVLEAMVGVPFTEGNQVDVLRNGEETFPAMLGAIAAACTVCFYRPMHTARFTVWNLRTHRRVLVCDDTVGITGGLGVDRSWAGDGTHPGSWRDTAFRVQGPEVAGLRSPSSPHGRPDRQTVPNVGLTGGRALRSCMTVLRRWPPRRCPIVVPGTLHGGG